MPTEDSVILRLNVRIFIGVAITVKAHLKAHRRYLRAHKFGIRDTSHVRRPLYRHPMKGCVPFQGRKKVVIEPTPETRQIAATRRGHRLRFRPPKMSGFQDTHGQCGLSGTAARNIAFSEPSGVGSHCTEVFKSQFADGLNAANQL